MFLQERLLRHKEKQDVAVLSDDFEKIVVKEKEIIDFLSNAEYTVSYMSMLLLKVEFLIKETQQVIEKVNKTAMMDEVKKIHILTAQQELDRLTSTKAVIQQAIQDLKTADVLGIETRKKEIQNKLLQEFGKETK